MIEYVGVSVPLPSCVPMSQLMMAVGSLGLPMPVMPVAVQLPARLSAKMLLTMFGFDHANEPEGSFD